ncbi:MAG: hypothetical protein JXR96_24260 [Deltaproteobacteria bacterium]|nr:hypothetical protein [Deltaproteobacteria bacterium]
MLATRIGIDIGALFCKAVRIDERGQITGRFYRAHQGDPGKALETALADLGASDRSALGMTGSAAGLFADILGLELLDISRCQIEAMRSLCPEARQIIDIGGGSSTLVQLDSAGRFQGYTTNSLCAAGTGSFLDEQARRLGISFEDMAAFDHIEEPPTIATRCTVFAKSDLIHRQQEGYSKDAMWSGLCRGMTRTLLSTLLNGRPLNTPVAIIGGVALNQEVMRWLRHRYPSLVRIPADPHLAAAYGAAQLARALDRKMPRAIHVKQAHIDSDLHHDWPLTLERSIYPSFETRESYVDDMENEVRLVAWPEGASTIRGVLGIDIGSTSTKLALVDEANRVVLDIYRKTAGDPIEATKCLFRAMLAIERDKNVRFDIRGVGTTGSGRKLVGKVIGADAIINEISAHVAGAVQTDPEVDTIFEIGGQDAKYMHVVDGHIRDSNMNYVCAAGTGSFVEEVSSKLGYPVQKVGSVVLGIRPPRTSDRCTVFMEQDVEKMVQSGMPAEEALAGVMVSVVKNYLNRVVGNRHYSREKIFFQGATARNPALVAAFERLLGVQVVVSPYCHVMGSYGVAMLTRQLLESRRSEKSSFLGLDLDRRKIEIRYETCSLCQNNCKIAFADIEGLDEKPSWGYMCGRDPEETRMRVNRHDKPLRTRMRLWRQSGGGLEVDEHAPVIGIPQALTTFSYLPLWRRFFNSLGFRIQLSGQTDEIVKEIANQLTGAEFCFPAKVAIGHAARLASDEGADFVFLPHMVSAKQNEHTTAAKFCPYVQAMPSYCKSALAMNGLRTAHILSPVIDMRLRHSRMIAQLERDLGKPLGVNRKQIRIAWQEGLRAQREFEQACRAEGQKILSQARQKGEKLLVLLGRPYNSFDSGLNLDLPHKLAEQGRTVLPLDFLDFELEDLGERYRNTYWSYGQKILSACERVAADPLLDAVYLTNFSCGPDSFLQSFAEEVFSTRPFLALELDEHGADAGYMTRIEAYFDVLRRNHSEPSVRPRFVPEPTKMRDRIIWIPPLHPVNTPLFAAAFRRHGYEAQPLPPEDKETFELGRSLTRGSECLPTCLTLGAFIKAVRESGLPPRRHAEFMPTAEGPCRFGQYRTLHRQALDKIGMREAALLSPSSYNSYQGIDEPVRRDLWKALLAADWLFKATCKVRPYEVTPGETNRVLEQETQRLVEVLEGRGDIRRALTGSIERFRSIPRRGAPKPLVGIVGEIYVRCNTFSNEDVVGAIERFGGEAWLAPMGEWILYTAVMQSVSFWDRNRNPVAKWIADLKNLYVFQQDRKMTEAAGPFLADRREPDIHDVIDAGRRLLPVQFEGEALLTLGRAMKFAEQGAALVVNCAPFGCMPGTLTTAIFRKLAPELKIPVVGMFYDGEGKQNDRLSVFLNNAVERGEQPREEAREARGQPELRA